MPEDVKKLAIAVHGIASRPWHEYDVFPYGLQGAAVIHFRLTDARRRL